MIEKVISFAEKYHMIEDGDCVITGVSGGADSVCLFLMLQEMKKRKSFSIVVAHIEHGVRGSESKEDAVFVENLCNKYKTPFVLYSIDVPAYAKKLGLSVEEAGRKARYEMFEKTAAQYTNGKIAIAHNQNDNAETMLHNLARGSALKGIAGIPPVRDHIIRPLLCLSRNEIEAYLAKQQQEYCTDKTNFELVYTRNKIRHEILPVLQELNTQAILHMAQTAESIREAQEYMEKQARKLSASCVSWNAAGGALVDAAEYVKAEPVIRGILLHQVMAQVAGSSKDITRTHIEDIDQLMNRQVGRIIQLPYGLIAKSGYQGVYIGKEQTKECIQTDCPLQEHKEFATRIIENKDLCVGISKKKYTKWLDYDKIGNSLCIRTRLPGDFFTLESNGNKQKLKQYFVNEKIPQEIRDDILLVADGSHIVWILGYRISAYYKVTEETKRILEVQYTGGKEENE